MVRFEGDDDFSPELRESLQELYHKLKDKGTETNDPATRYTSVSILDLLLVSLLCNRLYGYSPRIKHPSGLYRLERTRKSIAELLEELRLTEVDWKHEHHKEVHKGQNTTFQQDYLQGQATSALLKILFVAAESTSVLGSNHNPERPYNIVSLMELSLDKAKLKKAHKSKTQKDE